MEILKKTNILHLRDSPWVDGPGRTIIESAAAIDNDRYNYIIGAFTGSDKKNLLIETASKRNLPIIPIIEKSSIDFRVIGQVLDYIDTYDIHILHSHEFRSNIVVLICATIKNIPAVTTLHGWIANDIKGKLFVVFDKLLLRFFDRIIVVSKKMKQQLVKLKIPEARISVVQNAIIVDQYKPDKLNQEFRHEIGVTNDTILIGKIGRLSPEKGHGDLIRAFHKVRKTHNNINLVLLGTGPLQQQLESLTEELNLQNSVIFAGYRNDMQRIYNSLDIVVQSSYTEGMPNVLLEALLMKVPVIATDVGGTSEIIIDNQTGALIPPGENETISAKLKEFIEEQPRYRRMAEKGCTHVRNTFNFCERTAKLVKIYEEITDNN